MLHYNAPKAWPAALYIPSTVGYTAVEMVEWLWELLRGHL